jgi:hypothetical protein
VKSPYYYSVKARPIGRLNSNYSLYQNDVAKIKIPGITNLTGLPTGVSFRVLTNDTIQITTTNTTLGLINTVATVNGASSQLRFEILPAFSSPTALDLVSADKLEGVSVTVLAHEVLVSLNSTYIGKLTGQIFNSNGQCINEIKFESTSTHLNKKWFQKGNYIMKLSQGAKCYVAKFTVTN